MKDKARYANLDQFVLIDKLREHNEELSNPVLQKYMVEFMKPLTRKEVTKAFLNNGYTLKKETVSGDASKLNFNSGVTVKITNKHRTFNVTIISTTFIGTLIGGQLFLIYDNATRNSVFHAFIPWEYDVDKLEELFGDKNYGDYKYISAEELDVI